MPRQPQSGLAKSWCFTLNNYTEEEYGAVEEFARSCAAYACVGRETGENGTPHLQGYIRLKKQCRLSQLQDQCSHRAHYEVARGTPADNRLYCLKEGSAYEVGSIPEADGHNRAAIANTFFECMRSGRPGLNLFREAHPGTFAFSGHSLLRNWFACAELVERADVRCDWYYGLPGVGKSRLAHERFPAGYIKDPLTKWWNGYFLEKEVIIDDFGKRGIGINHLLRWFDRYKCLVEYKGGMIPLHAVTFVVTSNFHPRDCFENPDGTVHDQIDALLRRIHVTHMF